MVNLKSGFGLLKESFKEWKEDGALQLGAALAYYTIFSLAPMLLIAISVAGLVFGREAAQGELVGQMRGLLGQQGAEAIQTMVANAGKHSSGVIGTILGIVTILFGATGVFTQLQTSLNRIWDVEAKPSKGIWGFLRTRILSFGMVLGIGFLLLVSLVISAAIAAMDTYVTGLFPGAEVVIGIVSAVIGLGLITLLLAMIYRFLPDVKIAWKDVWTGAVITAVLFLIGKILIGLYLGNSSVASTYGAAGSLVVLLLWIYYSSQILFFGAEITQVYASRYGTGIVPSEHAVPVKEVRIEEPERERGRRSAPAHAKA
ncbi:MAG TPA: YihY/virulence factor BrkB family protein, partial [Thermoanaerobaculia bacterium]|nr:YihY/virulence factor BrkB family protein [Thermoanaerobaculia bacterium]